MKNNTINTINNMKNKIKKSMSLLSLLSLLSLSSCSDYLDIVPDNVPQYEDLFVSQKQAYNALATCYSALSVTNGNIADICDDLLGDEWIVVTPEADAVRNWLQGGPVMRGMQSKVNPLMDSWTGNNYLGRNLYVAIRHCDLFMEHVDLVPNMTAEDKADWKGQVMFLKAYYLFKLMQKFGPIILPVNTAPDAPDEDLFLPRSKVEDCFTYVLNLIDKAAPLLKERAETKELGQIDKVIALSVKAQVLLYRASPFYNGNSEYFANFIDHDGQSFFPQAYDPEKWKTALDAIDVALDICRRNGTKLFRYEDQPYSFDTLAYELNRDKLQKIYDLRFRVVDPAWNKELIWGEIFASAQEIRWASMEDGATLYKPAGYGGPGAVNEGAGYIAASLQSTLRYYSKHGLPLSEDKTIDANNLYKIVTTPGENDSEYAGWQGMLQPGVPTVQMYLDREPRFYSDLVITGGYYRAHAIRIRSMMFYEADCGVIPSQGTWINATGIGVQKIIHPQSLNSVSDLSRRVMYPHPLLRFADLLLMKAEAMNEYYGPSPEVYELVDEIRTRAGIPTLEEAYTNTAWVTDAARNKHLTQEGMREIIQNERGNEFAYERGIGFWDQMRWKKAVTRYSNPVWGWNVRGRDAGTFFEQTIVQGRKWSISDCLWPIKQSEMESNANLIQNPGW
jgi:hypothetical protein